MLRFIIRRRVKDQWSGLDDDGLETMDIDVPDLEHVLAGGGFGEHSYDVRTLAGVEVLRAPSSAGGESNG